MPVWQAPVSRFVGRSDPAVGQGGGPFRIPSRPVFHVFVSLFSLLCHPEFLLLWFVGIPCVLRDLRSADWQFPSSSLVCSDTGSTNTRTRKALSANPVLVKINSNSPEGTVSTSRKTLGYSGSCSVLHLEMLFSLVAGQKVYPLYMGLYFCLLEYGLEQRVESVSVEEGKTRSPPS